MRQEIQKKLDYNFGQSINAKLFTLMWNKISFPLPLILRQIDNGPYDRKMTQF